MASYLSKRKNAFKAAFKGLALFFKEEAHAKIHLASAIAAVIISFILHISLHDFIIIILLIILVIVVEIVNSAIEKTVDLAMPDIHPIAGKAKDLAAAAVLISSMGAFIIGIIIWYQYI